MKKSDDRPLDGGISDSFRSDRVRVNDSHAIRFDGPINNIHEAPAIGNGDLGALVQVFQNEFRLHLGKNDIWDARFDHVAKDGVVTQDDLIRLSRDYGFRLGGAAYEGKPVFDRKPPKGLRYIDQHPGWQKHVFPCPKPAGLIRIFHSGTSTTRIRTVIDITTGTVISDFEMEFGWHGTSALRIEAFVDRMTNAIRIRLTQKQKVGGVRLCVEKPPDGIDPTIPLPQVTREGDWRGVVTQTIPAGYGAKKFQWHLAGTFPQPEKGRSVRPVQAHPYRLWQACELQADQSLEFMVGVATERDTPRLGPRPPGARKGTPGTRARALMQAGEATAQAYDRAHQAHVRSWSEFWDRSGVELADQELEKTWYRNLFALACQIKPGAMAPGLVGNIVPWETSSWHGTFTVNMNTQKMFLSSVPTNHPEWIDCYADWLDHMKPSFRHLAKITFGLKGIHSPHMIFPYQKPERQASSNQCGRALGMTGWHGQPLWWCWEFFRDRKFLRQRAYPYFKEAACFYWRYLKKYLDESGDLYPSLNLEGPPWTKDFVHNRDPFIDLILFRNTFRYAIEAAQVLRVDAVWRKRWEWGLSKIRPVRVDRLDNGRFWIYADKNDVPNNSDNWRGPRQIQSGQSVAAAWTVFPGETVAGDEREGLAPALRQIMRDNHWTKWHPDMLWIHHWWCAIPALRMGLPHAFAMARKIILQERFPAGHARTTQWIHLYPDTWRVPEDNYLGVTATTEMLLQSQGGVIRLFPCWPRAKRAAFRGLPARGGFIIGASWIPGQHLRATIQSLAGEECRVRWTEKRLPQIRCQGRRVRVTRLGDEIRFKIGKGQTACFT
jgi:hypothetical protein